MRWSRDGRDFVHSTPDATAFVRELFAQHGDEVADLEVRRASLEDTYLTMVQQHGAPSDAGGHRDLRREATE